MARDAPAAHPLAARPRGAAALRPRLGSGRRSGRALLPPRRLRAGEEPRGPSIRRRSRSSARSSGRRRSATRCCRSSAGSRSFYGIVPPIPKESTFTYRGRIENVAAGMIPRIYNHSYTISADLVVPGRRRRGRDRGRLRPPGRLRALRPGRKAQAPLLDARRARVHAGRRDAAPEPATSVSRWCSRPTRRSPRPAAR